MPGARQLELENRVVLATVQALIGAVTREMTAVAVEVDASRRTAVVHVALDRADAGLGELLTEIADDVNHYAEDAVAVTVRTWVGADWTSGWPGRDHRMVYAAARDDRAHEIEARGEA